MFKEYTKIHRLGSEENDGILFGKCYIQEKIDGANTSIWIENGEVRCASRTQLLSGGFNGFYDYVQKHEGIKKLLTDFPQYRLYGEWLVKHSVPYHEISYRKWYMFDILSENAEVFMSLDGVNEVAQKYDIATPQLFEILENPSLDDVQKFVGKTNLGEKGEGVVIKNFGFTNKFGRNEYAKIVTQDFKELNAIVFGGNNKYSETYWEMYIVNKYMTLPRIQKIMSKLQSVIEKRLDMEHTARIINTAYHDMITEEIWDIQKKVTGSINFKHLSRLSQRKAAQIYHDLLLNQVSVADKNI